MPLDKPSLTLRQFLLVWEPIAKPKYKPSTWKNLQSAMRRVLTYFGDMKLSDVSTEVLEGFVAKQQTSPAHVRNLVKYFRIIWKSAKKWGYVNFNPFSEVEFPRSSRKEPRFFTELELRVILNGATEPDRTLYWLLAQAAIRIGEAIALTWDTVDFELGNISIRTSVWRGEIQTPKSNASVRTIPLSPLLSEHLAKYQEFWTPNPYNLLFANTKGKPWKADNLLVHHLHPLLKRVGIQRTGFHAFRHASATILDRMKAPLKVRQQRMGHASAEITLSRYTHVIDEDARAVAASFDQFIGPSKPSGSTVKRNKDPFIIF
jgi:integrase